jgi:hypothetical protein
MALYSASNWIDPLHLVCYHVYARGVPPANYDSLGSAPTSERVALANGRRSINWTLAQLPCYRRQAKAKGQEDGKPREHHRHSCKGVTGVHTAAMPH